MLIGIPPIISPKLIKMLMEMGHGDEIVLADGNFPAASMAKRLVRCDGHNVPDLLAAILKFFPLDTYVEEPVKLMQVVPGDNVEPGIWEQYKEIMEQEIGKTPNIAYLERYKFYEQAKSAYAIVGTSEMALYANIILKKGVITD